MYIRIHTLPYIVLVHIYCVLGNCTHPLGSLRPLPLFGYSGSAGILKCYQHYVHYKSARIAESLSGLFEVYCASLSVAINTGVDLLD